MSYLKDFSKRYKYMQRRMLANCANAVKNEIDNRVPNEELYKDYKDSMGIFEITDKDKQIDKVGIIGEYKKVNLREIDKSNVVFYFRPKQKGKLISEVISYLMRFEPFSLAMLPYEPSENEADLVVRRVSLREVNLVNLRLEKVIDEIRKFLIDHNIEPREPNCEIIKSKILADLGFFALRLEYGMDGYKKISHWRPALRKVIDNSNLTVDKKVINSFSNPKFRSWRDIPFFEKMRYNKVKALETFQDKVSV